MAGSKNVMGVVGLLCVNKKFRDDFYVSPIATVTQVFGTPTTDETAQIERLAGARDLPTGKTKDVFILESKQGFETASAAINCSCPSPPCPYPCPDNNDLY
jgi:hypothetical protein